MTKKYTLYTAISLVVANMVGTGVFTSLGFQLINISSGFAILMLWVLGGIFALLGALAYSELGVMMPRSGGEYHYLSKIYHPALGFMAGWISLLVGFAAPVAAAAIAFGKYLDSSINIEQYFPNLNAVIPAYDQLAIFIVLLLSTVHLLDKSVGGFFQKIFTTLKVLFIVAIILIGVNYGRHSETSFAINSSSFSDIFSSAFVVSMFFVTYSYSGWNASSYVASEIDKPSKNIPRSLIIGTLMVISIYLLLNFVFLYTVPIPNLIGKVEIGNIYTCTIFGNEIGNIVGGVFSILLISTISSMIMAGPRISLVIGEDYHLFKWLAVKNKKDIPVTSLILQSVLSIIYILTSTFEQMIIFIGFTLNLFTFLTVLGVIILRIKKPDLKREYKTFSYPFLPILFLCINGFIIIYGFIYKPYESIAGVGITLSGLIVYFVSKRYNKSLK